MIWQELRQQKERLNWMREDEKPKERNHEKKERKTAHQN